MRSALQDLRRTRRSRRLGDTEWFDLAYRVYLAGIFGGSAIIIASDAVGDAPLDDAAVADVFASGPAVLGIVAIIGLLAGLRSGSEGGPLSVEAADVRHLLLAPITRGTVLRRPLLQRYRTVIGGGALAGGVCGLLAAQRLPGSSPAWVLSGGAFGACVGGLVVGAAVIAHAGRVPGWLATGIGLTLLAWQGWAAIAVSTDADTPVVGPADTLGSLALWGYRQEPIDLVAVGIVVVLLSVALVVVGRLRIEQLARRGDLVSQLRFAVTTQDLRTVVLLRRQLRQEQPRSRPWFRPPRLPGASGAAVRRGFQGLARTPLGRFGRTSAIAAAAGVAAGVTARGTTPAVIACGILLFIMGLDLIEPLSQEIDHPDRTAALPRHVGWLHGRLLVSSLVATVPVAMVGAAGCAAIAPETAGAAFVLALPIAWAGLGGAVVNAIRDEHDVGQPDGLVVPPEMAGFKDLIRLLVPVVVSTVGALSILAVREQPDASMVVRCLIGFVLYLGLLRWWIVHRIDILARWRSFSAGAHA